MTEIDFDKVELVRERMLFSIKDMATLFGVSRATYYKWVSGGTIRERNAKRVLDTLRAVLPLIKEGHWPSEEAKSMRGEDRVNALLEMLPDQL